MEWFNNVYGLFIWYKVRILNWEDRIFFEEIYIEVMNMWGEGVYIVMCVFVYLSIYVCVYNKDWVVGVGKGWLKILKKYL